MTYAKDADLPVPVRDRLPSDALPVFREVANLTFDAGGDERAALTAAWAEVGKRWRPNPADRRAKWVKRSRAEMGKAEPGSSSVHVERPMGDGKPKKKPLTFHEPSDGDDEEARVEKKTRTLYVSRRLLNDDDLRAWAAEQGFGHALEQGQMHVTVAFSRAAVDWDEMGDDPAPDGLIVPPGEDREVKPLGEDGAVVLKFGAPLLMERWKSMLSRGATWQYETYQPHVTITFSGKGVDVAKVGPYTGALIFGPERFKEIPEEWRDKVKETPLSKRAGADYRVVKLHEEQRMVYGWASVITEKGRPVVDLQGDKISPSELEKATTEFMKDVRASGVLHMRGADEKVVKVGTVVHSFPMTYEMAKALGLQTDVEGWLVGVHVEDDATWELYKNGTLRAFSIGGESDFEPDAEAA